MLHGSNAELTIANIQRRAERRRNGDTDPDGRKLALVIEGGGMRSVYSGAGAAALGQLGLSEVFDEVYATSAGVMNASYFLTNQPLLGMSVYFENCTTRSFLNPWRFWKVLNVDYIVDHVAAIEKRLDLDRLAASRTHLLVSACDARSGELALIDTRQTKMPMLEVMRAAMAIPVLYNRTVNIDGSPCIDSGTILPFPLHLVIERGCTDILVLLTRPASFVEQRPSRFLQSLFNVLHSRGRIGLSRAYAERHESSRRMRDLALGRTLSPSGVNIAAICPEEGDAIQSRTTARKLTHAAAVRYGRRVLQAFGRDPHEFVLPE